jgi:hypothetical protein
MHTFSSFSEDCDFSDFFKPTNALIHFPATPMVSVTLAQPNMDLQEEIVSHQYVVNLQQMKNKKKQKDRKNV